MPAANIWASEGLTISSHSSEHIPMLFDSGNPTGGDTDLKSDEGMVLIISEDNDQNDPDDNAGGGKLIFIFDDPVDMDSIGLFDLEEQGYIKFYDATSSQMGSRITMPTMKDGEKERLTLNKKGISKMEVEFAGSGALTNLEYCKPGGGGTCSKDDFKGECSGTWQCKNNLYKDQGATDCSNSNGGVCFCGSEVCGCKSSPTPKPSPAPTPDTGGSCTKDDFKGECSSTSQCKNDYQNLGAYDCKNSQGGVCFCRHNGKDDICGCLSTPTPNPTAKPTDTPTKRPTKEPTSKPTTKPTVAPTPFPTTPPQPDPTPKPTPLPTNKPTPAPTESKECPVVQPNIGDSCAFEDDLSCEYGKEVCCDGSEHPSMVLQCAGGTVQGYNTDACMAVQCDCPDGQPTIGEACTFEDDLSCEYGEEVCCDGTKHPSVVLQCDGGIVRGFNTDACMAVQCESPTARPTPVPTPMPTLPGDTMSPTAKPGTQGDPHFKTHSGEMFDVRAVLFIYCASAVLVAVSSHNIAFPCF